MTTRNTVFFNTLSKVEAPVVASPYQKRGYVTYQNAFNNSKYQIVSQKGVISATQYQNIRKVLEDNLIDIEYSVLGLSCNLDNPFTPELFPKLQCKASVSTNKSFLGAPPISVGLELDRVFVPDDKIKNAEVRNITRQNRYQRRLDVSQLYTSQSMTQRNAVGAGFRGGAPSLCSGNVEYPYISNTFSTAELEPRALDLSDFKQPATISQLERGLPSVNSDVVRIFPTPFKTPFSQLPCYLFFGTNKPKSLQRMNQSGKFGYIGGNVPLSQCIGTNAYGTRFAEIPGILRTF